MQIRNRLTLQFAGIVALILLVFSLVIYQQAAQYTHNEFDGRLKERALNTGQLLLSVDEIDEPLLKVLRRKFLQNLPSEFVRVYDEKNKLIFKDDSLKISPGNNMLQEIRREGEYSYTIGKRQFLGLVYKDDGKKFVVLASAVDIFGQSKLRNLRVVLVLVYIFTLIIIILSGRFFARSALNPISAVVKQAEKITASNLYLRINTGHGKDEIEKLAITFNNMFERLGNAFQLQKSFVSNASHELRTPLTTITGEIEVALMKERSVAEYKKVLESILEETSKMTKLSNGLLQLAQAGSEFNTLSFQEVLLEEVLLEVHDSFQKHNKEGRLILDIKSAGEHGSSVLGSKELLMTALQNIVGNAFKFSGNKPVVISLYRKGNNVNIDVKDKGVGIAEKELAHIFQPFYRSDNVRNVPGHGIGLSMTDKIIKLHKGSIHISSKPGHGTKVTISLPVLSDEKD